MGPGGTRREWLEKAARERPEYADILAFFSALYAFLDGREGESGIAFADPEGDRETRSRAGFPLLFPESVRVEGPAASSFLSGIIDVIDRAGQAGREHLKALRAALTSGSLDLGALYSACLARERKPLEEAVAGVPAPLFAFVVERALKRALEEYAARIDPGALSDWKEGHCPVCGGRAGMDELVGEEGRRYLCCSGCTFRCSPSRG